MIFTNLKVLSVQFNDIVLLRGPFSKDLAIFPSWRYPLTYLVIFLVPWIVDGFFIHGIRFDNTLYWLIFFALPYGDPWLDRKRRPVNAATRERLTSSYAPRPG